MRPYKIALTHDEWQLLGHIVRQYQRYRSRSQPPDPDGPAIEALDEEISRQGFDTGWRAEDPDCLMFLVTPNSGVRSRPKRSEP